jgi:hypothetical protein
VATWSGTGTASRSRRHKDRLSAQRQARRCWKRHSPDAQSDIIPEAGHRSHRRLQPQRQHITHRAVPCRQAAIIKRHLGGWTDQALPHAAARHVVGCRCSSWQDDGLLPHPPAGATGRQKLTTGGFCGLVCQVSTKSRHGMVRGSCRQERGLVRWDHSIGPGCSEAASTDSGSIPPAHLVQRRVCGQAAARVVALRPHLVAAQGVQIVLAQHLQSCVVGQQ